jgi:shikimate dehydrogenase
MLLHQAQPAFEKWFGFRPKVTLELRRLVEQDIHAAVPQ